MPGPQENTTQLGRPAFFLAGQFDYIVPSASVQGRYFLATQVPAVFAELRGSAMRQRARRTDAVEGGARWGAGCAFGLVSNVPAATNAPSPFPASVTMSPLKVLTETRSRRLPNASAG